MSGWNDVGKSLGGGGSGRFVSIEEGASVRMRILDEEPHTSRSHKIEQPVRKGDKVENVFRSIPATESPDDSYILKHNAKLYPEQLVYSMRVFVYNKDANGKNTSEGEIRILQGGNGIFKPLKNLFLEHGSLTKFDITVSRTGSGKKTEYNVTAAPFPLSPPLDVEAAIAKLAGDATLQWENVFPKITAAEQQKMVEEAGFDITYDPAAKLAAGMTLEQAKAVKFTFGKMKDKTVGEAMVIDAGYVVWGAENINTNAEVAAACRVAVGAINKISESQEPIKQQLPPAPQPQSTPEPVASNSAKADLVEEVNGYFDQDPRFEDIAAIVELVKKHSGGKTRVKDLSVQQLNSLLSEIKAGA